MEAHDLMNSLVTTMEEYDDKISLQDALDGVRDFVCALLVTEGVDVDSFCAALSKRMPEVQVMAENLRNQEAE